MSLPCYKVYAIRYATVERRGIDNFLSHVGAPDGRMPLDFFLWAITHENYCAIVDTGFSLFSSEKRNRPLLHHPKNVLHTLKINTKTVNDLILTHLHYDHAGNIDLFENAQIHLQESEMRFTTGRFMAHPSLNHFYEVEDILTIVKKAHQGRVNFHNGAADILPGISVHHIGGHTKGLQVVRVHTARGWVVLASDAAHYYLNLVQKNPFPAVSDVCEMLEGYQQLYRLASSPEHIIPGHDPEVLRLYPAHSENTKDIVCLHLPPTSVSVSS